jgi:hypothetical protein
LTTEDYFVCPEKLAQPDERKELLTHEETLDRMEKHYPQYTVVRSMDLKRVMNKEVWSRSDLNKLRIALDLGKKEIGIRIGVSKDRIVKYFAEKIKTAHDIDKKLTSFFRENNARIIVQDYVEAFTITPIKAFESDKNVAFWLGCVLSDGTINKQNIAFYQKNYPEILGEFERITKEIFGVRCHKREHNGATEVKIRSKPFVDYMHFRYGLKKIIPSWFLSFPEEMRRSFLYTFVGLEAYMAEKFVFTQKNKHNVNMVSYMLRMEGIQHRIIDRSISRIKLYGKDYKKYLEQVGFFKAIHVESFPSKHRSIPLNKVVIEKIVGTMKSITSKPWYQSYRSLRTGRNHMTIHFAELLLHDAESTCPILNDGTVQLTVEVQYLQNMVANDVCYEQVKEIDFKPYKGLVYGLTVPGLQNYVAGHGACGINHNTYPLPEAQTDRFLLKIMLTYPEEDAELTIVNQYSKGTTENLRKILGKNSLLALQRFTRQVPIANDLTKSVVKLIGLTRTEKEFIEFGASPRASIGLVLACKARALMQGRAHVSAEDIRVMAYPILRHRIILNFEAERKGLTTDKVIEMMLKKAKI